MKTLIGQMPIKLKDGKPKFFCCPQATRRISTGLTREGKENCWEHQFVVFEDGATGEKAAESAS